MAVATVIALVLGLATPAFFAAHDVDQENQPSDQALTANFFSHEARFNELVQMLAADRPGLAAKGAGSIDLATVGRLEKSPARSRMYRSLLRQISAADLHYSPDSGKLVLVPDGEESPERPSKSYLFLPHGQPESVLIEHYGYNSRGPGVYMLVSDRPLSGFWFIHHGENIEVAIAPY